MNFNKSQVYSFGKKFETQRKDVYKPGPGEYNIESKRSGGHRFGSEERSARNNNITPGIGSYDLRYIGKDEPKYSFGSKGAFNYSFNGVREVPGPGNYNPTQKYKSLAYTMGIKIDHSKENEIPGPNKYSNNLNKFINKYNNNPQYSFGGDRKDRSYDLKSHTPGPGQYEKKKVELLSNKNNIPSFSFGKDSRDYNPCNTMPGPGDYELKNKINNGPKYSMGIQFKKHKFDEDTPGPGLYAPNMNNKRRATTVSIGKSARNEINDNKVPGPGKYNNLDINKIKSQAPNYR